MSRIHNRIPIQPTHLQKKNTLNDNRSFTFLFNIFMIEKGGVTERYHNG